MWKSIFKAVFTITAFSIATRVLGFLLKIYLSREIGAEALGIFQVALSICMVFITLVSSGLPLVMSKKTTEYINKGEDKKTASLVTACLIIGLITAGILISFVLILKNPLIKITSNNVYILLLYMLPCLISTSISASFTGYLWGKKKHFANSFSELFEQLIRIIFSIILISTAKNPFDGALKATIAMSIACVVSTILTFILYFKSGGRFSKPNREFNFLLTKSIPITLTRFINSLIPPLIAVIIPLRLMKYGYTNEQAMSLYGIISGMTMPLIMVPMSLINALSTALIPDLVASFSNKNYTECQNVIKTAINIAIFIPSIILPLFMSIGIPSSVFLFDNIASGVYLENNAWIMIPNAIAGITSSILNVIDMEVKSSKNYLIGSIFLILCIWFLPKYIEVNSMLVGFGVCMIIVSILNLNLIQKHLKFKVPVITLILKYILVGIPSFLFTSNIFEILNRYFTVFYSLAISCSLGFIFFILTCLAFKVIDFISIKTSFEKKPKNKTLKKHKLKIQKQI